MKISMKFDETGRNGSVQDADLLVVVLHVFASDMLILEIFQSNSKRGEIPAFSKQTAELFGI